MRTHINAVGLPAGKLHRIQNRPERLWPNVVDTNLYTPANTTASATPHTVGAWVEAIASTSGPVDWLAVWATATATTGADTSSLIDIGIGGAGSETVVAASLPAGFQSADDGLRPFSGMAMFPLTVPKGTRIAVRQRALIASDTCSVFVETYFQGLRCGSVVDTYGAVTASSRGTNMPASDTYVELTAATTQPHQALVMLMSGGGATTMSNVDPIYTLGAGPAAAETALLTCMVHSSTSEILKMSSRPVAIYSGHIPAGTRLAGKQSIGANYRDMIVLGIRY